jgi:hypothetical protein
MMRVIGDVFVGAGVRIGSEVVLVVALGGGTVVALVRVSGELGERLGMTEIAEEDENVSKE